jgi:prepilin-type N-terminal cleavage/methylation domain-containing protein
MHSPPVQHRSRVRHCLAWISRRSTRLRDGESGFTFVEVLVVCLIVGVLAAIAIAAFASQQAKAVDTSAKVVARAAQSAAETLAVDGSGSYEKVSLAELNRVEPAIAVVPSAASAYLRAASGGKDEYSVTARAPGGAEYTITRNALGEVTRNCVSPTNTTGCDGAASGSW